MILNIQYNDLLIFAKSCFFIQIVKIQYVGITLYKKMTQISTTFSTLKQQLHTFDTNFQTLSQKLSHITQARTKINNQLITLSKQYERKIKQLQNRLDQALVKNQVLAKENKLYQRDIEAFQNRLLEKEKLITMLIVQQGEKFDLIRTKSEIDRTIERGQQKQKDKNTKKSYQNILPKSINNTQTLVTKKIPQNIKATQQINEQNITNQRETKITETIYNKAFLQQEQNSQVIKNNTNNQGQSRSNVENSLTKTNISSGMNKKKPVPPKPNKFPIKQKNNSLIQQQNSNQNSKQQQIDTKMNAGQAKNTQATQLKTQQKQKSSIIDAKPQDKKIKSLPVPRPAKKPAPPNIKIGNNQKFLQDGHINIDQQQHSNQRQQNIHNNQGEKGSPENKYNVTQPFGQVKQQNAGNVEEYNVNAYQQDQYQQSFDTGFNQNTNLQKQHGYQNNEKQFGNKRQVPSPPAHKSLKSSKIKPKNPPKKIAQINFYEQSNQQQKNPFQFGNDPFQSMTKAEQNNPFESHSHNPFEQQPHQLHQKQHQEYQNNPSSEDFFSHFSAQPTPHDQGHTNTRRSRVIQAQESSIDYADTNSIISSTAVHMFDSQFLPQETSAIKPESQIKKMTKKKNKRQVQELDPDSFA